MHLKQVDDGRYDVAGDDGGDLGGSSRGHVGQGPARLLSQRLLVVEQHLAQEWQCSRSDDAVGLLVVASDDVADGAESGGLNDFFAG